jgi:hypothetical protein
MAFPSHLARYHVYIHVYMMIFLSGLSRPDMLLILYIFHYLQGAVSIFDIIET